MSQIQKHLVGLAQTATKKPVESGERLAASLVSQFKMKDGTGGARCDQSVRTTNR